VKQNIFVAALNKNELSLGIVQIIDASNCLSDGDVDFPFEQDLIC